MRLFGHGNIIGHSMGIGVRTKHLKVIGLVVEIVGIALVVIQIAKEIIPTAYGNQGRAMPMKTGHPTMRWPLL